jgi:hypothetical protein
LAGAVQAELDWGTEEIECTGAVRPADGGIRLRFSRKPTEAGVWASWSWCSAPN